MAAAYGRFARYYDLIYEDILDYKADCDYVLDLFRRFQGTEPSTVLDLGCGTGNHAIELARRGYEVTGLDLSESQLGVARRKARGARQRVRFIRGDMATFDLGRRFDAAICMFGGFGYMLTGRQIASHFARVRRHLSPGSVYVFEFWHEPAAIDRHVSWVYRQKPLELIRLDESRVDRTRSRITMSFQFFVLDKGRLVDRFMETHVARLYTVAEMRRLLADSGFRLVAAYGGLATKKGFWRPKKATFRITAVAKPSPSRFAPKP